MTIIDGKEISKRIKESKNFQEFLFLIGLTTHYLADSKIHPFINYQARLYIKKHSTKKECKEKQLKEGASDPLYLFVLNFLIDSNKKTGISTAKLNKKLDIYYILWYL